MFRPALPWLLWSAVLAAALCAVMLAYIASQTRTYIFNNVDQVPVTDVAMVLGASVSSSGNLSNILRERADAAVLLYQAHKVKKILVTGDNRTVSHNEVDPTARYLVSIGIRPDDIFLDHAGFDTYSSMYRAREVFGIKSVTVVSQDFHLPRAVYLARSLGLEAYGVDAPEGGVGLLNYIREIPATVKAFIDLSVGRAPKYLGDHYPITGDGRATWGSATTSRTDILLL